ncbi:MAG TPA: TMEM165/GDT1 family protein [Mycobacteriales bacterium]|nr:TMEM165/GDT1 family protein [Mycobacteriales bacterium]
MNLVIAATVFAAIFPSELPDKTFVATLVLATRFSAFPVWIGAAAAFLVQTVVAVAAGGALALLPKRPVHAVAALLFAAGAVAVLLAKDSPTEEVADVEQEIADVPPRASARRAAVTTFVVLFVAEWGDLSQLLTAAFAAKYRDWLSVGTGALLALLIVAGLGAAGGRALLRVVPVVWIRRVAAAVFGAVAVVTAIEVLRG